MDIKDLILLVGGAFFVAVLGHGLWLAWKARQEEITMDIMPSAAVEDDADSELSKNEFPSGGARITRPDVEPLISQTQHPAQADLPLGDIATQSAEIPNETSFALKSDVRKKDSTVAKASAVEITGSPQVDERTPPTSPDELIILGVLAKSGSVFKGAELVDALRGQGLKFGNMSIFHRTDSTTDQQLFSVANALEPGTFDLADMQALETPGITFFLQLPVPGDAFETLEDMLLSARTVAAALGGDVKDDQMNTLTGQTVEHMRQRLADYARRRLTQRPQ